MAHQKYVSYLEEKIQQADSDVKRLEDKSLTEKEQLDQEE